VLDSEPHKWPVHGHHHLRVAQRGISSAALATCTNMHTRKTACVLRACGHLVLQRLLYSADTTRELLQKKNVRIASPFAVSAPPF